MDWLFALALGYLLGSIPFGLLLAKAAGKGDIRQVGSGNIGATNVLRTGSKGLAAAVLLLDAGKGFAAVWLAARWWPDAAPFAALGAVLGHCFPAWLRFRGGKGVATTAGVCFGLGWPIGLVYAAVWLGMLAVTRISSLSGMSAAAAAPAAAFLLGRVDLVPLLGGIALVVLVLHRENFARLRAGTEPRVGRKR
ncbi:MAG TPA: glycerol-3-phosphate 1-O-acyltransferase PlsY [Croceibacterium sp.]|nr:glycerol-3-phosphate 1-O-acyltransferase PlsY [Croceibacterium sp.]